MIVAIRRLLAASLPVLGLGACSLALEPDRMQCTTNAECAADLVCDRGFCARTPDWACVTETSRPRLPDELEVRVIDIDGGTPMPGVTMRICAVFDLLCSSPTAILTTNEDGRATISVRSSTSSELYEGIADVRVEGRVRMIYMVDQVTARFFQEQPMQLPLLTHAQLERLLAASGKPTAPAATGHALIRTINCLGEPVRGIAVSTERGSAFYFNNGVVDPSAAATDVTGWAFLPDIGLDALISRAVRTETAEDLGRRSLVLGEGAVTMSIFPPNRGTGL